MIKTLAREAAATALAAILISAAAMPVSAQWLLVCGWEPSIQAWTCATVWWPYYQHLTAEPDWCQWRAFDTVWLKYDADYNVVGWYGVPAADLATQPPDGYAPSNWTVVGCGIVP